MACSGRRETVGAHGLGVTAALMVPVSPACHSRHQVELKAAVVGMVTGSASTYRDSTAPQLVAHGTSLSAPLCTLTEQAGSLPAAAVPLSLSPFPLRDNEYF